MNIPDADGGPRVAVITGAAGGMGAATARLLSLAGWQLLICDVSAGRLADVAASLAAPDRVKILAGDIADPSFPEQLLAKLNGTALKAFIHCAGLSATMGSPERILEVNLGATIALVDALLPCMAEDSTAVLFASIAGHLLGTSLDPIIEQVTSREKVGSLASYAPTPQAAYSVSKRGVQLLARRQALAFGRRQARIVSISPGIVDTPMSRAELAVEPIMREMIENSPLPRMGRPEEVASVVLFLCSAAASFVTGVDLPVDGGEITVMSRAAST